jgi:hypothetical protein
VFRFRSLWSNHNAGGDYEDCCIVAPADDMNPSDPTLVDTQCMGSRATC